MGEIKSSKGGKSQNQEQMIGLWQNGQKVMLRLVVDPIEIVPWVLALDKEKKVLRLHSMKPQPLSDDDISNHLHQFAKNIVSFNSHSICVICSV